MYFSLEEFDSKRKIILSIEKFARKVNALRKSKTGHSLA